MSLVSVVLFGFYKLSMPGSRKFCQRGSNFDNICLVDEGRKDSSTNLRGPASASQPLNGASLAYR